MKILRIPRNHNLWLELVKLRFSRSEVQYLGLIFPHRHIWMDLVKSKTVAEWLTQSKINPLLGFTSLHHYFDNHFFEKTHPIQDLTKLGTPFVWNMMSTKACELSNTTFTLAQILEIVDLYKAFVLKCECWYFDLGTFHLTIARSSVNSTVRRTCPICWCRPRGTTQFLIKNC